MPRTIFRASATALALALAASACLADQATRHPISRSDAASRTAPSGGSWAGFLLGAGGVAVALAGFGVVSLASKKARPGDEPAGPRVVGRVSLSPRQGVVLVRVGDRTLILGTGGQGPPSLLGEMPTAEPAASRSRVAAIGGDA